jgi:hypothetical protein
MVAWGRNATRVAVPEGIWRTAVIIQALAARSNARIASASISQTGRKRDSERPTTIGLPLTGDGGLTPIMTKNARMKKSPPKTRLLAIARGK